MSAPTALIMSTMTISNVPTSKDPDQNSLPDRIARNRHLPCPHAFPVYRSPPSVNINVLNLQPPLSLPKVSPQPTKKHNRKGQVHLEESFYIVQPSGHWEKRVVELPYEYQDNYSQPHPAPPHSKRSLERNLIERVAPVDPCFPEPNVCYADGAPREEDCKARDGL